MKQFSTQPLDRSLSKKNLRKNGEHRPQNYRSYAEFLGMSIYLWEKVNHLAGLHSALPLQQLRSHEYV